MRAVALSDERVLARIAESFIPLKVTIEPGTKEFPVSWPGLRGWARTYRMMGGEKCDGITACSIISPDLQVEYGSTGSALVWELFTSIAYDAKKFLTMLDRARDRFAREQEIRADESLLPEDRSQRLEEHRAEVRRAVSREGRTRLPPRGFTIQGAVELFKLTGDIPAPVAPEAAAPDAAANPSGDSK